MSGPRRIPTPEPSIFIDPNRHDIDSLTFRGVWFACCNEVVLATRLAERMHCPHCGKATEPRMPPQQPVEEEDNG
jgi:hypothetical protein